ncbi:PepSY domain-containing protein [Phenylobacterium sp. J426]|uniref:PepSY domain-containing protein n=1 Tax=Phenylobacterium sp. J426 TaxID=2898439 RepID=UPI002151AF3E|nr:PepSY domain-containing protein [Phenylobacterium sp. J426]MCR5873297.1 PepSY domain-containing protein [Phenylobacterium sp. J426]
MPTKTLFLAAAAAAVRPAGHRPGPPRRSPRSRWLRPRLPCPSPRPFRPRSRPSGGRAFGVELEHEKGVLVYEIDLVKDGRAVEVHVDAASGKVVRQQKLAAVRLPFTGEHLKAAQSAPRTLSETIALVESATKGRVSDIGLEREGGRYYYEAELAGAQDREVRVDLRTGAITPVIDD